MMSIDQEKSTKLVYRSFLNHDYSRSWTELDNLLWQLDFLADSQIILETECQLYRHSLGTLKCNEDHGESVCLAVDLVESANGICELWNESKILHIKNRYILQNYLAISSQKIIYVEILED